MMLIPDKFTNLGPYTNVKRLSLIEKTKKSFYTLVASSNFFMGNDLDVWMRFLNRLFVDSEAVNKVMFELLAHHFVKEHAKLTSALVLGKNHPKKDVVMKLLDLQVEKWVKDGENEAAVFDLLKLKQQSRNPFDSPIFFQWVNFVKAKYPAAVANLPQSRYEKHKMMFNVFAKQFEGDELTRVLVAGANMIEWKDLAKSLLDFQVELWAREKISDEKVFDLLQLHKANGNPFDSPTFSQWVNFVQKISNTPEEAYNVMLYRLSSYFKSKNALVGALDGAKSFDTKEIAHALLENQYKKWVEEKKNADDVFNILELSRTDRDLFNSPAFSAWVGFVRSTSLNDLKATETMLSTFKLDVNKGTKKEIKKLDFFTQKLQKALIKRSPEALKRQNDFDSNKPPAKRQRSSP
ncbi:unnamed protein product [Peronospora farinosa]|uniref:RxLR effector protein n=1 Tax=Peronospora farinosa TaxID=134698 RepID=A0AAV0SYG6_9STRA|nr:unnamed protein product [Peronospora farinosa]